MTRILWLVVLCVVQCLGMSLDELEDFSNFLLKTSSLDIHMKKGADPDVSFDEDEIVSDHAWEDSGKFEGDLILNDRQRRLIVENVEGLSRNGLTDSTKRWPDNEVIYFIQKEHFTSGQVQAIQAGIDDLGQASCVKFRPYRKGDRDAVVIQGSRRGCFSQVGYQGGYQVLNLSGRHPVGRGCFRHGTVVHELLHTLGFYHMQSSPDRDDYISVVWANIVQPARHNFRKYNSFSVSDFGVGYDYDSVLHYSRKAFSSNGQDTLVPKKHGAAIGQRAGLSDKDTQKLNKMYCDADNDAVQADENTPLKPKLKKKPKNQPFEGHGIGYHQGKTVVINLPAAQTYKLRNVPSIDVFDFSKTPQTVSTPEAEGYRFGQEVTYLYPSISPNKETITDQNIYEIKSALNKNTGQIIDDKVESSKELEIGHTFSPALASSNEPAHVPIDTYDTDLDDAFDRLSKIIKQQMYPQNVGYNQKINKDYSKFYTPLQSEKSGESDHDSFNEKLEHHILYPSILAQKEKDENTHKITITDKSNDKFKHRLSEDRMDDSYRTTLPIKDTYSTHEQTETPPYATLEYLKDRHDFSNFYSSVTPEENEHSVESPSEKSEKQDAIKINPYDDGGFYTDYVIKDSQTRLKQTSDEGKSDKVRPSKYILPESPVSKHLSSTNKHLESEMHASFRTLLPTHKPYSAYEQTETPKYATLDYLKDKHDISGLYTAKTTNKDKGKGTDVALGYDIPLAEDEWYEKESYAHNPANYDEDSYTDYIQQNRKRADEIKSQITEASHFDGDDEARTESSKSQEQYNYSPYESEYNGHKQDSTPIKGDDENREKDKRNRNKEENYDSVYYSDYNKEALNNNDDGNRKNNNNFNSNAAKYTNDYTDYDKESQIKKASNENSEEVPKKSLAYTLYGAPVPLTRDWYKPNYSTDVLKEFESSRSHEDDYR